MNRTEIFKSKEHFDNRPDKEVNGVSIEFVSMHESYEEMNSTNRGCWNCDNCQLCFNCENCSRCIDCYKCKNSTDCRISNELKSCHKCTHCINLSNSSELVGVNDQGQLCYA